MAPNLRPAHTKSASSHQMPGEQEEEDGFACGSEEEVEDAQLEGEQEVLRALLKEPEPLLLPLRSTFSVAQAATSGAQQDGGRDGAVNKVVERGGPVSSDHSSSARDPAPAAAPAPPHALFSASAHDLDQDLGQGAPQPRPWAPVGARAVHGPHHRRAAYPAPESPTRSRLSTSSTLQYLPTTPGGSQGSSIGAAFQGRLEMLGAGRGAGSTAAGGNREGSGACCASGWAAGFRAGAYGGGAAAAAAAGGTALLAQQQSASMQPQHWGYAEPKQQQSGGDSNNPYAASAASNSPADSAWGGSGRWPESSAGSVGVSAGGLAGAPPARIIPRRVGPEGASSSSPCTAVDPAHAPEAQHAQHAQSRHGQVHGQSSSVMPGGSSQENFRAREHDQRYQPGDSPAFPATPNTEPRAPGSDRGSAVSWGSGSSTLLTHGSITTGSTTKPPARTRAYQQPLPPWASCPPAAGKNEALAREAMAGFDLQQQQQPQQHAAGAAQGAEHQHQNHLQEQLRDHHHQQPQPQQPSTNSSRPQGSWSQGAASYIGRLQELQKQRRDAGAHRPHLLRNNLSSTDDSAAGPAASASPGSGAAFPSAGGAARAAGINTTGWHADHKSLSGCSPTTFSTGTFKTMPHLSSSGSSSMGADSSSLLHACSSPASQEASHVASLARQQR